MYCPVDVSTLKVWGLYLVMKRKCLVQLTPAIFAYLTAKNASRILLQYFVCHQRKAVCGFRGPLSSRADSKLINTVLGFYLR